MSLPNRRPTGSTRHPRALKPERVQAPFTLGQIPDHADETASPSPQTDASVEQPRLLTRYRVALVVEDHAPVPVEALALGSPSRMAAFFWQQLQDSPQEVMLAAYLDTRHQLIGWQHAFRGTLHRTAAEPRLLLQAALLLNAAGVVVGHNHPSGDPTPSREDLHFTRRLGRAGEVVGVELVDHLVIGGAGDWVSLRERGGW